MTRRAALVLAAVLPLAGCGGDAPPPTSASAPSAEAPDSPAGVAPRRASLLLPSTEADGLKSVAAEIFPTSSPADQAKQVVGLLLAQQAAAGTTAPFPAGTALRSVFIDPRGTAVVSLSREARERAPGGSTWERLAVSSLAGSLERSVPQVKRVQILIEGEEIESLTGHLDLRFPVALDASLVLPD